MVTTGAKTRYVICVRNQGYLASLEKRKIYQTVPDAENEGQGLVRVVDESGEDYLFPADMFVPIEVPTAASRAFSHAS